MDGKHTLADSLWAVTDWLRGRYDSSEYGIVLLSFIMLRRADCLRGPEASSEVNSSLGSEPSRHTRETGLVSQAPPAREQQSQSEPARRGSLESLLTTPPINELALAEDLTRFATGLPSKVAETLEAFGFEHVVRRLAHAGLLRRVVSRFATLDLDARTVPTQEMGVVYEEVTRWLADASPIRRGEHSTPLGVAELTARLLVGPDAAKTERTETVRVYDPCCGSGGLLATVEAHLRSVGDTLRISVHGQEVAQSVCGEAHAGRLLKGAEPGDIRCGDVLLEDLHRGETFDYLTAAPPLALSWKNRYEAIYEEADLGWSGRFGAGLPRPTDASLLFLQHVVAHMRPAGEGGARAALLFDSATLSHGGPGSGESSIRQWLLEQDLLEGIVALPDGLWPNHGAPMYIWVLSNRKPPHLRNKFLTVDAYGEVTKPRRGAAGINRPHLTSEDIARIVERYTTGCSTGGSSGSVLFEVDQCVYLQVVVDRPLRLRFEVSDAAITAIAKSKALEKEVEPEKLMEALRGLSSTSWPTWPAFTAALASKGQAAELKPLLAKVVRQAVAVSDESGEIQKDAHGAILPDMNLRRSIRVYGEQDVVAYLQKEVLPQTPDALVDQDAIQTGWTLPLAPFLTSTPTSGFGPLSSVARLIPSRGNRPGSDLPLLNLKNLYWANSAADLTDGERTRLSLTECTSGDVVGQGMTWRVLPDNFGNAFTPLTVLRPYGGAGLALCEWLRTGANRHENRSSRVSVHALVPVDLITDPSFQAVLKDLQAGRDAFERMPRILPNVFQDPLTPFDKVRRGARTAASEARVLEDLARPMSDSVWRAEMTYPYPVAVLCRQYRVATSLAQRKEALLKLGEALTRCIGVLALRIQINRKGQFSRRMRTRFANGGGATFGTWDDQIKALVGDGDVPELPELAARDLVGEGRPLSELRRLRNQSGHASRVQPEHELKREVAVLRSLVVTALESAGWLSGIHWDVVDLCAYTGQGGFTLSGRRLRGSHPDWEPFERPHQGPVEPHRLYVRSLTSPEALDLWQVARVELCTDCDARELFLLHRVDESNKQMVLRCGRDHELVRDLVTTCN
ncbi:N-6 DNA methylase [Streptomyces cinereoruber]|uniref:class I SAM-dependent DNA methyltransferase n=1 Tax=Streptomyces cinereoruber TaxID=67260 RepID=UPI003C2EEF09